MIRQTQIIFFQKILHLQWIGTRLGGNESATWKGVLAQVCNKYNHMITVYVSRDLGAKTPKHMFFAPNISQFIQIIIILFCFVSSPAWHSGYNKQELPILDWREIIHIIKYQFEIMQCWHEVV